jgi:hypothetical protein
VLPSLAPFQPLLLAPLLLSAFGCVRDRFFRHSFCSARNTARALGLAVEIAPARLRGRIPATQFSIRGDDPLPGEFLHEYVAHHSRQQSALTHSDLSTRNSMVVLEPRSRPPPYGDSLQSKRGPINRVVYGQYLTPAFLGMRTRPECVAQPAQPLWRHGASRPPLSSSKALISSRQLATNRPRRQPMTDNRRGEIISSNSRRPEGSGLASCPS